MTSSPDTRWFTDARFGAFIHWGPYAQYGRGEQVLFREHLDQREYARRACEWDPQRYDPTAWADVIRDAGMRYAVLTTRHHDGYCLWDSKCTDYTSTEQAPGRDLVAEYADAFRSRGLRVGLYYSLIDWRIPAWYLGPERDPEGWGRMREYIHVQVEELLSNYGEIAVIWFDGLWPRTSEDIHAAELIDRMRELQPSILINNRLGVRGDPARTDVSRSLGDFGTPEHQIRAEGGLWESCQVTTWRLWGYTRGERWRNTDVLLDMLCECAGTGGNLLLNVGPEADGGLPPEFVVRAREIGAWLKIHGEAVYGSGSGDVTEMVTRGWQTVRGNNLYLIIRFWDGLPELRLADLTTPVTRVSLLTTEQELGFVQKDDVLTITDLPSARPTPLFPVIRIECDGPPEGGRWGLERLWGGDPTRCVEWARSRGTSVWTDGEGR